MGRRITRAFSKDLKSLTIKIVKVNKEHYKVLRRENNPNENKRNVHQNEQSNTDGTRNNPTSCRTKFVTSTDSEATLKIRRRNASTNVGGSTSSSGVGYTNLRHQGDSTSSSGVGYKKLRHQGDSTSSAGVGYKKLRCQGDSTSSAGVGCKKLRHQGDSTSSSGVGYKNLRHQSDSTSSAGVGYKKLRCQSDSTSSAGVGYKKLRCQSDSTSSAGVGYKKLRCQGDSTSSSGVGYKKLSCQGDSTSSSGVGYTKLRYQGDSTSSSGVGYKKLRCQGDSTSSSGVGYKKLRYRKTFKGDYKCRSIVQQLRLGDRGTKSQRFTIRKENLPRVVKIKSRIVEGDDCQINEDCERVFNSELAISTNIRNDNKLILDHSKDGETISNTHRLTNQKSIVTSEDLEVSNNPLAIDKEVPNCKSKSTEELATMDLNLAPIDYSSSSNTATSPGPLTPPSTPKRNYKKQLLQLHRQQEAAAAAAAAAAKLETCAQMGECSRSTRKRTVSERDGPGILERVPQVSAEVFTPNDDSEPIRQRLKKQGIENEKITLGPNNLHKKWILQNQRSRNNSNVHIFSTFLESTLNSVPQDFKGLLLRNELLHIKKVQREVHSSIITPPAEEDNACFDYLNNLEAISDEETNNEACSEIDMSEEEASSLRWREEWMQANKRCVKIQRKLQELLHLMYQKYHSDNNRSDQNTTTNQQTADEEGKLLRKVLLDLSLLQRFNYFYPDWEMAFIGKVQLLIDHLEAYQKRTKDARSRHNLFMTIILYILKYNLILPKVLDVYPYLLFARYEVLLNIRNRIRYDCENFPGSSVEATDTLPLPDSNIQQPSGLNYQQRHSLVTARNPPELTTQTHNSILNHLPRLEDLNTSRLIQNPQTVPYQPYTAEIPQVSRSNTEQIQLDHTTIQNLQTAQQMFSHYQSIIGLEEGVTSGVEVKVQQQVSVIKSTAQASKEFKYEPKPGWVTKAEIIPYLNGDYLVLHPAKRRRIVKTYKPIIVLSDSEESDDEEEIGEEKSDETNLYNCLNAQQKSEELPKLNYINKEAINDFTNNTPSSNLNPVVSRLDQTSAQEASIPPKNTEHQFDHTNQPHNIHTHPNHSVSSPMLNNHPFNIHRPPNQTTTNNFRNINSLIATKEIPNSSHPIMYQRSLSGNSSNDNQLMSNEQIDMHPLAGMILNERVAQFDRLNGNLRSSGEITNPQPQTSAFIYQRQLSQLSNSSSGGGSVNGERPATLQPQGYVLEMKSVEEMNIPEDFKSFYEFVTKSQITNGNEPIRFTTFLELHNAGNLKTYQKKYVEYLKMKEQNGCR